MFHVKRFYFKIDNVLKTGKQLCMNYIRFYFSLSNARDWFCMYTNLIREEKTEKSCYEHGRFFYFSEISLNHFLLFSIM